jgi:phage terminase small subunit
MMPKGGYRASSGRPREANSRRSLIQKGLATMASGKAPDGPDGSQADTSVEPENLDPLAYMLRVMNDPGAEPERRDRMTIAAAPFVHPRATDTAKGKKEEQAERAQAAATGRFAPRPPPKFAA